jgi:hypothetical protein
MATCLGLQELTPLRIATGISHDAPMRMWAIVCAKFITSDKLRLQMGYVRFMNLRILMAYLRHVYGNGTLFFSSVVMS